MEKESVLLGSFSRMAVTAGLSLLVLFVAVGWQVLSFMHREDVVAISHAIPVPSSATNTAQSSEDQGILDSSFGIATSSSYDLSKIAPAVEGLLIGGYTSLKAQGNYNPESVQAFADQIAPSIKANVEYRKFSPLDIPTDADTSYARTLAYRKELGDAVKPLMKNTDAEIEIYAHYIDTKDPKYLDKLRAAATNYDAALSNATQVKVPIDAVAYHIAILNALGQFSSTLKALATYGDDPFAGAALLRTYNAAENNMYTSFKNLAMFYKHKAA